MTLEELKSQLSKQYNLVCFEDFACLTKSTEQLYETIKQYHLPEYHPDQRLVFYTCYQPSLNQLCQLQMALALIDISNCFVLLCSPYDLQNDLFIANEKHGYDQTVINNLLTAIEPTEFFGTDSVLLDTLCPLPWMHLEVERTGSVTPCCFSSLTLGNLKDSQTQNLFYSKDMQDLRSQMLRGEKPTSCQFCWQKESYKQISHRQRCLSMYQKDLLSTWISSPKIRSLDLKLGNTCNFKCKICDLATSSLRISEELKFATAPAQKEKIQQIVDESQWYDNIENFLHRLDSTWPDLLNLDITGGEPFLLKSLPGALDRIITLGHAEHIRLHFHTNGSVFPENLISKLSQFRLNDIAISIDNLEEKFESERGGHWQDVVDNVQKFLSLDQNKFRVYVYCTVNIQNILDLDDMFAWGESNGVDIVLNILENPLHFSIDQLTAKGKQLVIEKYQNSSRTELRAIATQVQNSVGSDGTKFVAAVKQFDQRRQQNFVLSHQAIAIAMGFTV
jgi:MoaA/NifB/PqqE/SkfB family radical SAM enzyme